MKYDLPLEDPIYSSLYELARKRGIVVVENPFPEKDMHFGGFLIPIETSFHIILINRNYPLEDRTFTFAHELAHYALHRGEMNTDIWASSYDTDITYRRQKEEEADRFARRLISFIKRQVANNNDLEYQYRRVG